MLRIADEKTPDLAPGDFCWGTAGTVHMVNNAGFLMQYPPCATTIHTSYGVALKSVGFGTLEASLADGTPLVLHEVHYVPGASVNFISANFIIELKLIFYDGNLYKFDFANLQPGNRLSFENAVLVGSVSLDIFI
ncbi:hypothetical protein JCM33374_g4078 [Metschnikowia sp. JCM 33374]|nr:hypothetical protein JCM33374_g4078 [Metschnikowia sp. JCM 33374]